MNAVQEYEFHRLRRDMERVQNLSYSDALVHFHVMKRTAVSFGRHEALQGSVKSDLYSQDCLSPLISILIKDGGGVNPCDARRDEPSESEDI